MSKYIKPPRGEDCYWRKGPPPSIGWWPAGSSRWPAWLRYWNGQAWSVGDNCERTSEHVALDAAVIDPNPQIEWTDKWWEQS